MFFEEGRGSLQSVFGWNRKFWRQQMKTALDLIGIEGFPYQLPLMKTKIALPIPAVSFTDAAPSLKKVFNKNINFCATPVNFFMTKFREIFEQTKLRHTSAAESKHCLHVGGPDMKYWPQQLNFAVYVSIKGCGISHGIFDSGLTLPQQIRVLNSMCISQSEKFCTS